MNALLFLALAMSAILLLAVHPRQRPAALRSNHRHGTRPMARRRAPPVESMPRLVRQMAALLTAGRTGELLWQAMAQVVTLERHRAQPSAKKLSRAVSRSPDHIQPSRPAEGTHLMASAAVVAAPDTTLFVLLSVQRATSLGLPVATAIRSACHDAADRRANQAHPGRMSAEERGTWMDIAACFAVCDSSGAPVAAVLERLATTLEADHDAAAHRETALAGPRSTVRLLSWLPLVGLGLGMLMGVDPLGALFGSPMGWTVLTSGIVFAVVGRVWSARMIAVAAQPSSRAMGQGN